MEYPMPSVNISNEFKQIMNLGIGQCLSYVLDEEAEAQRVLPEAEVISTAPP